MKNAGPAAIAHVQLHLDLKTAAKTAAQIERDEARITELRGELESIVAEIEEASDMAGVTAAKEVVKEERAKALDARTEYLEAREELKEARKALRKEAADLLASRKAKKAAIHGLESSAYESRALLVRGLASQAR